MTLEEFRRTAGRPAAPLPLHDFTAPRTTGAAPAAPAGSGVSGAPISIPQSAGANTHIRPAEATPVPAGRHLRPQPPPRRTRERTTVPARLNPPLPPAHPSPPSGPSGDASARLKPRPTSR